MKNLNKLFLLPLIFIIASCSMMTTTTTQEKVTFPSTIKTTKTPTSDSAITDAIQDKFVSEKLFSTKDITSVTIQAKSIDGTVYLVGLADNKAQFDKAVTIAYSVTGVKDVDTSQLLIANQ